MDIYDYITADSVEVGDQIFHANDPIEISRVIDSGEAIMLKGYSHMTGDDVAYVVTPDTEVGLWAV